MNPGDTCIVLCTAPDPETARTIARAIVDERLAACASMTPQIQSIYLWQGKVEEENETQILFKTNAACYPALEKRILELHPYEVPEIIACPVTSGLNSYLLWVNENTASHSGT